MHYTFKHIWGTLLPISVAITHSVAASQVQNRSVDLPIAEHIIPLRRLSSSQHFGRREIASSSDITVAGHSTSLRNVRDIFGVDVTVGDTVLTLLFDTGAPFTWVLGPGFQCASKDGTQLSVPKAGNYFSAHYARLIIVLPCDIGNRTNAHILLTAPPVSQEAR